MDLRRKGQRCRFYTPDGRQVGPEQANLAPAVAYALSQGWQGTMSVDWLFHLRRYHATAMRFNGTPEEAEALHWRVHTERPWRHGHPTLGFEAAPDDVVYPPRSGGQR